ncbi:MtaA/CmuA family methyltransferase [Thermincola ferriacetica]|uniref:MtaA/CmuA family methyltransferase n=1 Tax=Thermincola ferriacetica TaxID=281456 RepID=A0A0L6W1F7_9FIRM|nr:MtaA/CmuA family methyltransferase [Thermincola ferriacetica]KNZ69306.1 MtaA/CmuA family methyltransferase [Thermincola ferriacetica]
MSGLTPRERVLRLFEGKEVDRPACYSGMGNVTTAGLEQFGYKLAETHGDAGKMANAAASSYKLFGYECAVVPFDLCVEAEALGCVMNPYEEVDMLLYPTIKEKIIHEEADMTTFEIPDNLTERGRIPVVAEAIKMLKTDIGKEVPIGTYLLGPFTLAGQLMDLNELFKLSFKKQKLVAEMLDRLADVIIKIIPYYEAAGADYICIREMGATTDILSPRVFKSLIQPPLIKIAQNINVPKILHICGSTNSVITVMQESGYDALSIEQKNDMVKTRADIGKEPLVFGALDAYNVLVNGTPEDVRNATVKCLEDGVDAVWPGCDIWPTAPVQNLKTMVDTVKELGAKKWQRKAVG